MTTMNVRSRWKSFLIHWRSHKRTKKKKNVKNFSFFVRFFKEDIWFHQRHLVFLLLYHQPPAAGLIDEKKMSFDWNNKTKSDFISMWSIDLISTKTIIESYLRKIRNSLPSYSTSSTRQQWFISTHKWHIYQSKIRRLIGNIMSNRVDHLNEKWDATTHSKDRPKWNTTPASKDHKRQGNRTCRM